MAPQQLFAGGVSVRLIGFFALVESHDQHDPHHDDGQGAIEPDAIEPRAQHGTGNCAGQGTGRECQAEPELRIATPEEGNGGGNVLGEDGDAVGAIGDRAGNAHEDHDGYGQQGTAAGHNVEKARYYSRGRQQSELPEFQYIPQGV